MCGPFQYASWHRSSCLWKSLLLLCSYPFLYFHPSWVLGDHVHLLLILLLLNVFFFQLSVSLLPRLNPTSPAIKHLVDVVYDVECRSQLGQCGQPESYHPRSCLGWSSWGHAGSQAHIWLCESVPSRSTGWWKGLPCQTLLHQGRQIQRTVCRALGEGPGLWDLMGFKEHKAIKSSQAVPQQMKRNKMLGGTTSSNMENVIRATSNNSDGFTATSAVVVGPSTAGMKSLCRRRWTYWPIWHHASRHLEVRPHHWCRWARCPWTHWAIVPHLRGHAPWRSGVGKTALGRMLAMMFSRFHGGACTFRSASDLDFFRRVFFDKTCPALYDDGDSVVLPLS